MKHNVPLVSFNRGLISRLGLARKDIDRLALSASVQNNFMPRTLGSMMLRPGYAYKGGIRDNLRPYHAEFIYANDDTAIIELTDSVMRVRVNEAIITRVGVSSTVTNSTFGADLAGWTDADETGASSDFAAGGYMSLIGTRYNAAIRRQEVTVSGGDAGVEHALRIVIERGPVILKVGSTAGGTQYVAERTLETGTHSIAFVPSGNFHIELSGREQAASLVDSCAVETAGDMEVPVPYPSAALRLVRYEQSGNIIYVACDGYQQYKIKRFDTGALANTKRSWSMVKYEPNDGPFLPINVTTTRLTPSGLTGDITLAASRPFFSTGNIGSLFRISSVGQNVEIDVTGDGQWSDPIRVTGVDAQRVFNITIAGTWSGIVTLQRSVGEIGTWSDVTTYSSNTTTTYDDTFDNQIIFYRIGIDTGDYVSGTAEISISYSSGGITGIVRVTGFNDDQSVNAAVIKPLGAITASEDWEEGEWSPRRSFPTSVCLYEGRLFWAGRAVVWGSVSDAYESFDSEVEGDSGTIRRTIGQGPVDIINWLVPSQRLVIGAQGSEWVARSSSLDEPLSPTNFNMKDPSNQGSAAVAGLKVDSNVLFVQKSGIRLFQTGYLLEKDDYQTDDLTKLIPEIAESGIVRIARQRQPDTRIHCVLENGTVAVLILDSLENVKCWVTVSTLGDIEDVLIMPGTTEDAVYYTVAREVDGDTVRYFEKWSMESECAGGTYKYQNGVGGTATVFEDLPYIEGTVVTARDEDGVKIGNYTVTDGTVTLGAPVDYVTFTPAIYKLADSHILYSGVSSATIVGLDHLEGEEVVVFGDGKDLGTYTVASGQITVSEPVEMAIIGLTYMARFKSVKFSEIDRSGPALLQQKIINQMGVLMQDTHAQGLRYGTDFDNAQTGYIMDDMPGTEDHEDVDPDFIWPSYDKEYFSFDGTWDTDSRLCLEAAAPRPCNLLAAVVGLKINEKNTRDDPA